METTAVLWDNPGLHSGVLGKEANDATRAEANLPSAASELMTELLSAMRMGAILVTRDARVISANEAGRDAMAAPYGLALRNGQLFALAPDTRRKLAQALVLACDRPFIDGAVLLSASHGNGRMRAMRVVSLERLAHRRERTAGGLALLCIGGPRSRTPEARTLAQVFGLTAAESALMEAIAGGERLHQCAARREVSLATVRAQLRNVFVKTGATTQADLVAIAWSIPGLWLD